jgi:hypothetical protein
MAKLKPGDINKADLIAYLQDNSDFSFEVQTLNALVGLGFTCEHGGTYKDPATKIPREYDIRATRQMEQRFLHLAVECKNLRSNFPLLISCLPRRQEEAFHNISISDNRELMPGDTPYLLSKISYSKSLRRENINSLYPAGQPVGKSCDQVGRLQNGSDITSSDSDIYPKWAQALSSAHDLIYSTLDKGTQIAKQAKSLVIPLVVVPNNRLWRVQFDVNGQRISDPEPVEQCSYFVNHEYTYQLTSHTQKFVISHLHFTTSDGLSQFANYLCSDDAKKIYNDA